MLALIRQADTLDGVAARRVLSVLRDARTRVAARLISAEGFNLTVLSQLQNEIDFTFQSFRTRALEFLNEDTVRSFELGGELVDNPLRAAGANIQVSALPNISTRALEIQFERNTRFITNLSQEVANRVNGQILLSITGEQTPQQAMAEIGRNIKQGVFKTAADRAEAIVRTEVNTVLNNTTLHRLEQAKRQIPGLRKFWMHAGDTGNPHARGEHIRVWQQTDPRLGGTPIPINQDFIVGGERASGPHDPRLSAKNVIRCRCRLGTTIAQAEIVSEPQLSFAL